MPRIPDFRTTGDIPVGQTARMDLSVAGAQGKALAQAGATIADFATDYEKRISDARDANYETDFVLRANRGIYDITSKYEKDSDYANRTSKAVTEISKYKDVMFKDAPEHLKLRLENNWMKLSAAAEMDLRKSSDRETINSIGTNLSQMQYDLLSNPQALSSPANRAVIEDTFNSTLESSRGALGEAEYSRRKISFQDSVETAVAKNRQIAREIGLQSTLRQIQTSIVTSSPEERKKIVDGIAPPAVTDDEILDFIFKWEGSKYDEDGSGMSKYGIYSEAHPDVDVKNITRDGAAKIYKEQYIAPARDYPLAVQMVAADAFVQHGVDEHTKKMISDANGDPYKLIDIRRAYYHELAKNPKKAKSLNGWLNRMDDLERALNLTGYEKIKNETADFVSKFEKQLDTDPAGAVAQSPDVVNALANYETSKSDADLRAYVNTNINAQIKAGVAPYMTQPVSKAFAERLVADLTAQGQNPEQLHAKSVGLSRQYGEHTPALMRQLLSAGLPPANFVLANLTEEEQKFIGAGLAEAAVRGKKLIFETIDKETEKDIDDVVSEKLLNFKNTSTSGDVFGSIVYSSYADSAKLLAGHYVNSGMSAAEAVKKATDGLVNQHYSFVEKFRVHKDYDAKLVARGAAIVFDFLPENLIENVASFDEGAYARAVKNRGYWVNADNENNLTLVDEHGFKVAKKDGSFFEYPMQFFIDIAKQRENNFRPTVPQIKY